MTLDVHCPPTWPDNAKLVIVGDGAEPDAIKWSTCPRCHCEQNGIGQCRSCNQSITLSTPSYGKGSADRLLFKAMQVAGIEPATVAVNPIVHRGYEGFWQGDGFKREFFEIHEEPIYTKTGKLSKRTSKTLLWSTELTQCVDQLAQDLRQHNPNLIVAAGNEALEVFRGHRGVADYRGSILDARGAFMRADGSPFKVLAVEHPKFIVRGNLTDFWILAHDLKKAAREAEFPDIRRYPFTTVSDPQHELNFILASIGYLSRVPSAKWTLDVETRAGTLACYSIAYRLEDGSLFSFCVPLQTTSGAYWSPEEECLIWGELYEATRSNPNLCNQNVEYDLYYLLRHGIEPAGVYMDTMLAHSILYPEFPKGLDFLCSFYLDDVVYWKQDARDWTSSTHDQDLWGYCCKDAVYTLRVVEQIDQQLETKGLYEFYHGYPLQRVE